MRKLLPAALLAALPITATAAEAIPPSETVVVNASALDGVWKITKPDYGSIKLFHDAQWGAMHDSFCRMEHVHGDLAVHCFAWGILKDGRVSIEGKNIHFAWGTMMLRIVIDGDLQSATQFGGTFAVKFSGIEYDDPVASSGTKLTLSPNAPDGGGKSALLARLLGEMTKGAPTATFDTQAGNVRPLKAQTLQALGAVQSIIYLGTAPKPGNLKIADFFSVYDVEFAGGQRICGLHQRDDGTLDGFTCV
jgi:hypothetical protein